MKKQLLSLKRLSQVLFSLTLFLLCVNVGWGQTTINYTTAGTGTWLCPTGVTSVEVKVWGAGGGGGGVGGNGTSRRVAGGGSAGSYVTNTFTVVPGTSYNYTVGASGTGGTNLNATLFGIHGGKSEFSGPGITTMTASGGTGGVGGGGTNFSGKGGKLGGINTLAFTGTGTSYTTGSAFTITGGGGTGATVKVGTVASGSITYLYMTDLGTGYTSAPTISATPGSGLTFTASLNPNIDAGFTTSVPGADGGDSTYDASGGFSGVGGNAGGPGGGSGGTSVTTFSTAGIPGNSPGGGGGGAYGNAKGGNGGVGQVSLTFTASTTSYYYKGTGSLNDVANWGINTDGSGTSPLNFTDELQKFVIRNTATVATDANWTVSGSLSKIVLGDPTASAVALTIGAGGSITGTIDVAAASTGSNTLILENATYPTLGVFDNNSVVHLKIQPTSSVTNALSFGTLFIDGGSLAPITIGGTAPSFENGITINNKLTVATGSILNIDGTFFNSFFMADGATADIYGTVKTARLDGLAAFGSAVSVATNAPGLQFANASTSNLVLYSDSLIDYNRTTGATQKVTSRSDYAYLTLTGGINSSHKSFLGPITVSKEFKVAVHNGANIATLTNATPITILPSGKFTFTLGTFNTAGYLTLKSDATGTAVVGTVGSTNLTGNVVVERYIPAGHRAYRALSSPTTGGTLNSNWQEGQADGINGNVGYGTHLTGTDGATNGFDTTASNAASIYTYNGAFSPLASTSAALNAADSYLVFVRGSRQSTNISGTSNDATTLRTTGTLKTGTFSATGLNASDDGFSLVGNPYQAQVNMTDVLTSGSTNLVTASLIIVDPTIGTKGSYVSVDLATGLNNVSGSTANQYLQPGQACFVKTTTGTPTLQFTEANKSVAVAQTSVFKTKQLANILRVNLFNAANTTTALDGVLLTFDASESNDVNDNDCSKLTNFDESMATSNSGKLLSIEKRANPISTDEIPLNITKYRGTSYVLKVQGTNLSEAPYLVDTFTNTTTEIPVDGTLDYAFNVDATNAATTDASRFKLIYAKTLNTHDNEVTGFALYPNPSKSNSFNVIVPQSTSKASLSVSNLLGQKLYSQKELQSGATAITVSNVKTAGVYLVTLTLEGKKSTTKWIVE